MADATASGLSKSCVGFDVVYSRELDCILGRRGPDEKFKPVERPGDGGGAPIYDIKMEYGLVGLALSGGGIRSAAFSLGVMQALDKTGVLKRVDYLSTVSGGGYIGSSLSAGMSNYNGKFPFESQLDSAETPSIKHIRDYSNFLMPHGKLDLLASLVIYLRGIVANIILVLPWLLLAAALTVWSNPTRADLSIPDLFGYPIRQLFLFKHFPFDHFVITSCLLLALLVLFAIWALIRSGRSQVDKPEVPSGWTTLYGWLVGLTALLAFFELQPFVLAHIQNAGTTLDKAIAWLQGISVALAPVAAVIVFLGKQLEAVIQRATEASSARGRAAGFVSKLLLYVAAAAMPLLLWAIFFQLVWWGIADNSGQGPSPRWLAALSQSMSPYCDRAPMAGVYFIFFVVLLILSMWLQPNANSLHRLYRDRLSKAFLFKPVKDHTGLTDLAALDGYKLSQLDGQKAPYHLINTALNLQGSKYVNKRGRNADFFMFSRNHVGSEATKYIATEAMEKIAPELDLGTAMAVSAAAASSNMGAHSIKPLTITLALLNVRLGFWLRNPRFVGTGVWKAKLREFVSLYFLWELLANLSEKSWNVYVTDGGHIENLGLYELLKRRCKVILVVDAEADPKMNFRSFMTLQRYARIDLGVRIDLPWQEIRDRALAVDQEMEKAGKAGAQAGPHCAIGEIEYADGDQGIIIYIKSSITGDENDYTLYYKARYPLFPHESTGDQFFSEEQFEVYRALGFHAGYGLFGRREKFAHLNPADAPRIRDHLGKLDQLFPRIPEPGEDPSQPQKKFSDYLK